MRTGGALRVSLNKAKRMQTMDLYIDPSVPPPPPPVSNIYEQKNNDRRTQRTVHCSSNAQNGSGWKDTQEKHIKKWKKGFFAILIFTSIVCLLSLALASISMDKTTKQSDDILDQQRKMVKTITNLNKTKNLTDDAFLQTMRMLNFLKDLNKTLTQSLASIEKGDTRHLSTSCKQIINYEKNRGTGIYHIRDLNDVQYPVYCDMELDGGGWTLVASIHENNLSGSGRCTSGDKWSSEQGSTNTRPEGDGNWMNQNIFGHVTAATSDDYKNPGYFEISARDIMIWHVPNSTPLRSYNTSAYLQYRTNNHFFDRYNGSNLYHLYKDYFPIKSGVYTTADYGPSVRVVFDKGNADEVMLHQAPNAKSYLEPGFVQFRLVNSQRNAFALSPGVRHKSLAPYPQHSSIGSTGYVTKIGLCGDLAGYGYSGVGTGKTWSVDSVLANTAFFIFYR